MRPSLVNYRGAFLSYDVTHKNLLSWKKNKNRRKKRHAYNKSSSNYNSTNHLDSDKWIFYKLAAYGREFHLNLTLNENLVTNGFSVEYRNRHGRVSQHNTKMECHYVGHIASEEKTSNVALSNCYGLVTDKINACNILFVSLV